METTTRLLRLDKVRPIPLEELEFSCGILSEDRVAAGVLDTRDALMRLCYVMDSASTKAVGVSWCQA